MEVCEPPASYSEYRDLPDEAPRYEIIGGAGYLTPSPGEIMEFFKEIGMVE